VASQLSGFSIETFSSENASDGCGIRNACFESDDLGTSI
jgi:hypothetical protein